MLLKTRLLFVAFCFVFSCLSFSSELSVKATPQTQKSEDSTRQAPQTQQEEKNTEPLLTDKEYSAILDSSAPPSYYNFKRVLEYMHITSLKEYLDFLEELEIEHFPKSPKKYYGNQWEDWPQKKLGDSKNSDKAIEFAVNKIIALERGEAVDLERNDKFISYDTSPAMRHTVSPKSYNKNATPIIGNKKTNWMPFEEARAFVQKAGIKTVAEFRKWIESGNKPPNFPSSPYSYYRRYWVSWYHFFGIERKSRSRTDWMEFEEARAFIQKKGIKKYREFYEWIKSEDRNPNVPSNPRVVYKKDWVSWRHFFGTEGKERHLKDWMSYEEARAFVQKAGIKTYTEFREWNKAGKRPSNFPANPHIIYAEDWKGWPHFFGTEGRKRRNWMSFEEAQALMQKEGIKTYTEFKEWKRAGKRPANFPGNPDIKYKKEWVSWPHFFGTEGMKISRKNWMSFAEAQALMQKEGIKTYTEFKEWKKAGKRPSNFPSNPAIKYKKDWKGWPHFLGREARGGKKKVSYKQWMSYEEARAFMQKEGIKTLAEFKEWSKTKRPPNFPSNPNATYEREWVSWSHFLGTNWMSFKKARAYIQKKGIKTYTEFKEWKKTGNRPLDFPANPHITYKEEWVNWFHFLGTDKRGNRKNWMSFAEAQAVIQKAGIKTFAEFREWSRAGHRPPNFPGNPHKVYKKDWVSWYHFFGTAKCKKAFK